MKSIDERKQPSLFLYSKFANTPLGIQTHLHIEYFQTININGKCAHFITACHSLSPLQYTNKAWVSFNRYSPRFLINI